MSAVRQKCNACEQDLPMSAFGTSRGIRRLKCKQCVHDVVKARREQYRLEWIAFFEDEFGTDPSCQVCGTVLQYMSGDNAVCFDHRRGNEAIDMGPSAWAFVRPCNDDNRAMFTSCDFGILCRRCNSTLPTVDRKEWAERVLGYVRS